MSLWGRIFAATYDHIMRAPERATLRPHRAALIPEASGSVLEIGGGTGANLPFYAEHVERLTITEPEAPMARRLERHVHDAGANAVVVRAPAEDLPFEDDSFDVAVATLVLCTVADQQRALAEIRRVLRPAGRLLFLEHVRSDDPRLARWQDRLNPLQRRVGHGCNCNRPTLTGLTAAGFTVTRVEHDTIHKAPPIVRPLVVGVAESGGAAAAA